MVSLIPLETQKQNNNLRYQPHPDQTVRVRTQPQNRKLALDSLFNFFPLTEQIYHTTFQVIGHTLELRSVHPRRL